MSGQNLRTTMSNVAREVRAYLAPVERTTGVPAGFDATKTGEFALDAPPAPWIAAGCVRNLKRTGGTKIEQARAGAEGATVAQFRKQLDARVEFEFAAWGKLQMAAAGGGTLLNVLACDAAGRTTAAVRVLDGSTASALVVGAAAANFAPGAIVAVDGDYRGETGYVGGGVAAAYVAPGAAPGDADFLRRVTFNVARVESVTEDTLMLAQPLIGGAPAVGAGVQMVAAFTDREGDTFFQEWSLLLVAESETGGRVLYYYPRVQSAAPASEAESAIGEFTLTSLRCNLVALPAADGDGQSFVCSRTYVPAANAALW